MIPPTIMRGQDGYTMVDLLVTLLVAMILSGVLFSIYRVSTQWIAPWQREITLEDHVHLILQRLTADLTYAEQVIHDEEGAWILTYPLERRVLYRHRDSTLTRNDHPMHDATVPVVAFALTPSRPETRYALRRRDSLGDDERSLLQVEIRLALQSRERTLAVTTATALRRQRPWYPLP